MQWKEITGWPGYEISETGVVRSLKTGVVLQEWNGYVRLNRDRKHRSFRSVNALLVECYGPRRRVYLTPSAERLEAEGEFFVRIPGSDCMVSNHRRGWSWRSLRFVRFVRRSDGSFAASRRISEEMFGYDIPSLPGEEWRRLHDYPGIAVSNLGRVWGDGHRRILRLQASAGKKYLRVSVNSKQYVVHRLVALAFCANDNPGEKTEVDHINEDKLDNRSVNLRWCTPEQNREYYASNHYR